MAAQYGFPDAMQRDIDDMAGGNTAGDGPIVPPPGVQPLDPAAMQNMMQAMMQNMMQMMRAAFQQAAQGAAASGTTPRGVQSVRGRPLEAGLADGKCSLRRAGVPPSGYVHQQ